MVRRAVLILMFLCAVGGLSTAVWWRALNGALTRVEDRGRADLALASDRLLGQLQRYREMATLIAAHPDVLARAEGRAAGPGAVDPLLRRTADVTRSDGIVLADTDGRILGSSDPDTADIPVDAPFFRRAMHGALGFAHSVSAGTGARHFVYAAPVFSEAGPVVGALIVRVETEAVEVIWRGEPMIVFFTDPKGVAFVSNRDELVLAQLDILPGGAAPGTPPRVQRREGRLAGREVWDLQGGRYLPSRALHLTRALPVIGMTGEALVDIAPAERLALAQASVAAALCCVVGAAALALEARRRALRAQLAAEEEANQHLESRVSERTRALSEANAQLKRTQAELVQAGKLSALGQMSAGISHELNQPLMAIRSYAENAALLLDRGEGAQVAGNLDRIGDLAHRMGRIIRNLRAFARQESEGMSTVDLVKVIAAALELSDTRLARGGITVDWAPPAGPLWVRGGEVRLQQVVINLLSNAADAMPGGGTVTIRSQHEGARVRLSIADNGTGIADPSRIFDPFYSTKEVGAAEGMGLGLSISYGIVQSFGGTITGANRPEGGAEFTLTLDAGEGRSEAA